MSDFFKEEDEEVKPKKKSNDFFVKLKKQGKVVSINKNKGKITIDVNGNGEMIDYNEKEHSNLKVGDPIEF